MRFDFLASAEHYRQHLEPVMAALGDQAGTMYRQRPPRSPNPMVVASGIDLASAASYQRCVVLMEHGASQRYEGVDHRSYAGGRGRQAVALFLCVNQACADANLAAYPSTPSVVVGSPRLAVLRAIARVPGPTSVAIAFHWRCRVAPEAGTALDHYKKYLRTLRERLDRAGVDLIGHGHPRIAREVAAIYATEGIEWVPSFAEVVARADAYVCDNSSTLFEMAALDRPVVVLNCPRYRRDVSHGLRFWDEADVGVQVDGPGDLLAGILAALADPAEQQALRRATSQRVYPFPDEGAQRAADALRSLT